MDKTKDWYHVYVIELINSLLQEYEEHQLAYTISIEALNCDCFYFLVSPPQKRKVEQTWLESL